LTRAELDARVLRPLVERRPVVWDDRQWTPEKVKLAIYESPALGVEEIGMGRGWGNVTKDGENVTERLIAETREEVRSPAALDALKDAILARARTAPVGFEELLALAEELATDLDPNQRTTLAARAVWEPLGQDRLRLSAARAEF